jgi:hypothetical protein
VKRAPISGAGMVAHALSFRLARLRAALWLSFKPLGYQLRTRCRSLVRCRAVCSCQMSISAGRDMPIDGRVHIEPKRANRPHEREARKSRYLFE